MAINPIGVFDDFDPVDGEPPEDHLREFKHIIYRAREILSSRSREDIFMINDRLRWILSNSDVVPSALKALAVHAEKLEKGEESNFKDMTESEHLLKAVDSYSLEDDDVKGLKWSELFAVQALGYVSLACSEEKEHNECDLRDSELRTYENLYKVSMWGLDAMESIGYALMYKTLESGEVNLIEKAENLAKAKISLKNKKAAIMRHKKTSDLKNEFYDFFNSGSFPSKSEGARKFLESLSREKRKLLAPSNAVRTLVESLSNK